MASTNFFVDYIRGIVSVPRRFISENCADTTGPTICCCKQVASVKIAKNERKNGNRDSKDARYATFATNISLTDRGRIVDDREEDSFYIN